MPKGYAVLWAVFAAAYGVWMAVFMPKYVLDNYENMPAEMLVDGKVYPNLSGMVGAHWLYPIWVVISVAALLLFIVYFKKFLYCKKQTNAMTVTAAVLLVAGCVFVVVYGFLGEEPFINKVKFVTASMIGLEFPWLFRVWGVLGSASVFIRESPGATSRTFLPLLMSIWTVPFGVILSLTKSRRATRISVTMTMTAMDAMIVCVMAAYS